MKEKERTLKGIELDKEDLQREQKFRRRRDIEKERYREGEIQRRIDTEKEMIVIGQGIKRRGRRTTRKED